jgi:hypothetical protein
MRGHRTGRKSQGNIVDRATGGCVAPGADGGRVGTHKSNHGRGGGVITHLHNLDVGREGHGDGTRGGCVTITNAQLEWSNQRHTHTNTDRIQVVTESPARWVAAEKGLGSWGGGGGGFTHASKAHAPGERGRAAAAHRTHLPKGVRTPGQHLATKGARCTMVSPQRDGLHRGRHRLQRRCARLGGSQPGPASRLKKQNNKKDGKQTNVTRVPSCAIGLGLRLALETSDIVESR